MPFLANFSACLAILSKLFATASISFGDDLGLAFLNTLISFSSIIQYGSVTVFHINLNGAITKLTKGFTDTGLPKKLNVLSVLPKLTINLPF